MISIGLLYERSNLTVGFTKTTTAMRIKKPHGKKTECSIRTVLMFRHLKQLFKDEASLAKPSMTLVSIHWLTRCTTISELWRLQVSSSFRDHPGWWVVVEKQVALPKVITNAILLM
jgi:hypothetical protein